MTSENKQNKLYLPSTNYTLTSSLLLPSIGLSSSILIENGFVNAFLGDCECPKTFENKNVLYLLFHTENTPDNFEEILDVIRELDNFEFEYDPKDGEIMIVLSVPTKWNSVFEKFKLGKYGDIPREYIEKYFTPRVPIGTDNYGATIWKPSKNWMILNRDINIRRQIEEDFNIDLDEKAEVFSKPGEREYYRC